MVRETKKQRQEREEAAAKLREFLSPGDTVYTVLRHVSRSGMSRRIDLYAFKPGDEGRPPVKLWLSYLAAKALGWRLASRDDGIVVGGCGMDMGFHLVSSLGYTLWPNGTDEPHGTRNGEPDRSGGYALRQEWI